MAVVRKVWGLGLHLLAAGVILGCGGAWAEPVTSAGSASAPQKSELTQAQELFQNKDFDGALKMLRKAVERNSDLPPAQLIMAQLYANANQGGPARTALELAVVEDPKDPEAYLAMADVALAERRVTEADLLLTKASEVVADFKKSAARKKVLSARVANDQAAVAEARGNWAVAQKSLEDWLSLDPKNVAALQRLAKVLFLQNNTSGAEDQLKQIATINRENKQESLNPYAQMARLYESQGKHALAKTKMEFALQMDPNVQTNLAAAQWAVDCGELTEAKKYAQAALAADPNSLDAKMTLGVISYYLEEYETADQFFQQVLSANPANIVASNNLALSMCEEKEDAKKLKAFQYALVNVQRAPKQADVYSTLGWTYFKLGKLNEAAAALQTAIQMGPISRDTAYFSARVVASLGNKDVAKNWLKLALDSPGPFPKKKEALQLQEALK
jgi:tetratricopeptide (TPR) repeat protein